MSKVTGKFQVTLPKWLVTSLGIKVGDNVEFCADGDRIALRRAQRKPLARAQKLRDFDRATERQQSRQRAQELEPASNRGWNREELYRRDRSR